MYTKVRVIKLEKFGHKKQGSKTHIFPHLNINKLQGTLIELPAETFISLTGGNIPAAAHICQAIRQTLLPAVRADPDTKLSPVFPELNGVAALDRLPRLLTECPTGSSDVTASHDLTILEQPAEKKQTTNKVSS